MIRKYCKAYYLCNPRQYSAWTEKKEENESELTDQDVVYLWDCFTVVRSPVIPDKGIIFDNVTPEWQDFYHNTLKFEIPEDLRSAYEQKEESGQGPREQTAEAREATT
ncbi:hypothetical protein ccbrp13_32630 [Ktedonobacteria bacterium brp13]|nr:hypothetical protein ccbrp13_32630 [Ktedonobacteria bacterium brp13]